MNLIRYLAEIEDKTQQALWLARKELAALRDIDLDSFSIQGDPATMDPEGAAEILRLNAIIRKIDEALAHVW